MKNINLILLLVIILFQNLNAKAIEADDSVDEIIKKKYNAQSQTLPKLPSTSPNPVESENFLDKMNSTNTSNNANMNDKKEDTAPIVNNDVKILPQKKNIKTMKVGWGKKVNVKFANAASDGFRKGKNVIFISQSPIITRKVTIPSGTKMYGSVTNSHSPQILGNGGLLAIKIDSISYNGNLYYCEGNIVKLNHNNVFFNNIKGDNGYIKGVKKTIAPAKKFYDKSLKVSKKLWNSPGFIIAPVTYLPGAIFLISDAAISPFIAIFSKGEKVYIPQGTTATIKLTKPIYIEYE